MLEIIRANFNIKLNELARIKTENNMMQYDLIIFPKLLKIFTLIILINSGLRNLQFAKVIRKKVDN